MDHWVDHWVGRTHPCCRFRPAVSEGLHELAIKHLPWRAEHQTSPATVGRTGENVVFQRPRSAQGTLGVRGASQTLLPLWERARTTAFVFRLFSAP